MSRELSASTSCAPLFCRLHPNRDLLTRESEIPIPDLAFRQEFLERLVFVLLPIRVIEILVKENDGSRHDPVGQQGENGARRAVDVAVDMDEGDRPGIVLEPFRQGG